MFRISATYRGFVRSTVYADTPINAARQRFKDAIYSSGNFYNNNVKFFVPSSGLTISVTEVR